MIIKIDLHMNMFHLSSFSSVPTTTTITLLGSRRRRRPPQISLMIPRAVHVCTQMYSKYWAFLWNPEEQVENWWRMENEGRQQQQQKVQKREGERKNAEVAAAIRLKFQRDGVNVYGNFILILKHVI
jgi:hypothetical protein